MAALLRDRPRRGAAEDFGVERVPDPGPLLDRLSVEFREKGWSMKTITGLIVTSSTYRQSSRITPDLQPRSPRTASSPALGRFRMPSLLLRNWAREPPGSSTRRLAASRFILSARRHLEAAAITKRAGLLTSRLKGTDLYRRSLTFWRRTVGPANMFDASNRPDLPRPSGDDAAPRSTPGGAQRPDLVEAARSLAQERVEIGGELDARLTDAFVRSADAVRGPGLGRLAGVLRAAARGSSSSSGECEEVLPRRRFCPAGRSDPRPNMPPCLRLPRTS